MADNPLWKRENHCFVSYASEDAALARRIADWLDAAGLRVWLDQVRQGAPQCGRTRYKYFLAEWVISKNLGLAQRTFCVSRAALPVQLQAEAIEVGAAENASAFEAELVALHDATEASAPYVFLATDHKRTSARNEAARDIVEHVLGMECVLGKDSPGEQLREAIVEKIRDANLVIADLACVRDESTNRLLPNLNTWIEAGVAIGARRPVFPTALDPASFDPDVANKTTQVPFMFRNSQIQWYGTDIEYLARVHRLVMSMRRRIINEEVR